MPIWVHNSTCGHYLSLWPIALYCKFVLKCWRHVETLWVDSKFACRRQKHSHQWALNQGFPRSIALENLGASEWTRGTSETLVKPVLLRFAISILELFELHKLQPISMFQNCGSRWFSCSSSYNLSKNTILWGVFMCLPFCGESCYAPFWATRICAVPEKIVAMRPLSGVLRPPPAGAVQHVRQVAKVKVAWIWWFFMGCSTLRNSF